MSQAAESSGRAVVLLSGGLDSATCLALARARGFTCHTLALSYGQRHDAELRAARRLSGVLGAVEHKQVNIDLDGMGGSALTDASIEVPDEPGEGIPVTYVPARNTLMLSVALGWAEILDADQIFIGVNAVDYSGYPDCRPEYIESFQAMANLATRTAVQQGRRITIQAPLVRLSKAQIIERGLALGVDYAETVSCYRADRQGRGCGRCDACRFRRAGFEDAGRPDPTRYQTPA